MDCRLGATVIDLICLANELYAGKETTGWAWCLVGQTPWAECGVYFTQGEETNCLPTVFCGSCNTYLADCGPTYYKGLLRCLKYTGNNYHSSTTMQYNAEL